MSAFTDEIDERIDLEAALCCLTVQERRAIQGYWINFTQRETADCMEISRGRVNQLLACAMAKMANYLSGEA